VRVAFASSILSHGWGGADELWGRAADACLSRGLPVWVGVGPMTATDVRVESLRARGAMVVRRGDHSTVRGTLRRWSRRLRGKDRWVGDLMRWRPDVVVVTQGGVADFLADPALYAAITVRGCPYVLVCQSNHGLPLGSEHATARRILGSAQRVVFVSRHNRLACERQVAGLLSNAIVLQNPVDRPAEPPPWPVDATRMAYVGRIDAADKGLDLLLSALAAELSNDPEWALTLYGIGTSHGYLLELSAHLGVSDRVEFAGFEADRSRIWSRHGLLVLPSRHEGCSLAMLEALHHGRAVLATAVGGVDEWVRDGETGFVCASHDVASLRLGLRRAWGERTRWQRMGELAREDVGRRHDPRPEESLLEVCGIHATKGRGERAVAR
jgi:glycosyltransferase involved in cell wall biosynthesis